MAGFPFSTNIAGNLYDQELVQLAVICFGGGDGGAGIPLEMGLNVEGSCCGKGAIDQFSLCLGCAH